MVVQAYSQWCRPIYSAALVAQEEIHSVSYYYYYYYYYGVGLLDLLQ